MNLIPNPPEPDDSIDAIPAENHLTEDIVEDRLVHAMLKRRYHDDEVTMQRHIDQALARLKQPAHRTWRPWRVGLSTAAAAVVVVGLLLMFSSPRNVQADFGPVLAAFDSGDKTYKIEIGDQLRLSPKPDRPIQRRMRRGPKRWASTDRPLPRPLNGAVLYTRADQYVLEFTTREGRKIAKGFDGQQSWLAGPWREPKITNDPNLLHEYIPDDIASLLFLDLRDIFHQVSANYEVHELADAEAPNGRLPVRHFIAKRHRTRSKLPRRIELWFDPTTDQLQEILCIETGLRGPGHRLTLRISLVSDEPLPTNWFAPAAHLSGDPTP